MYLTKIYLSMSNQSKTIKVGSIIAISKHPETICIKNRYPVIELILKKNEKEINKKVLCNYYSTTIQIDRDRDRDVGRAWIVNELNYKINI